MTLYRRILQNYFFWRKMTFFCNVIFEKNTSKIKNRRLNCKTTDLGEDDHTFFKDQFWLFIGEFSETLFLRRKFNFHCDVIFEQNLKNRRLNCKTTDLGEDDNTFFKDQFLLFIREFSETSYFMISYIQKKWLILWRNLR